MVDNEGSESDDDTAISGSALQLVPSVRGIIKSAAALMRRTRKVVSDFNE